MGEQHRTLIGQDIEHWAELRPDGEALNFEGESYTWGRLYADTRKAAGGLQALGVQRGDRVAVYDKNHPSCLVLSYAGARIGSITTVVNWRLSARELIYVINDCGAKVLFVGAEFLPVVGEIRDQLTHVSTVIVVGGDNDEYTPWREGSAEAPVAQGRTEDDSALILYTSGTTGFPKGANLTHKSVMACLNNIADIIPFDSPDEDQNLVILPLFHVGGLVYAMLGINEGARTIMTREVTPEGIFGAIARGATHVFLVPALMAGFVQAGPEALAAINRLKRISYGASPMPQPVIKAVLDACPDPEIISVYGSTELSGAITYLDNETHRTRPDKLGSVGLLFPRAELRVVSAADGIDQPAGESGELWFRTDQTLRDYWGKPEATAETITEGGWLRTGDIGWVDEDGFIYVADRLKDMIITGGENVYSIEVEQVLSEFPGVAEAAVIGIPDERMGEQVQAVIAYLPGKVIDHDELLAYCKSNLAGYKCPRSIVVVDQLPRGGTGKILKKKLREQLEAQR